MDGTSWKQELQQGSGQPSSLEVRTRERANRGTEVIAVILIATAAIGFLVSATLALVDLNLP